MHLIRIYANKVRHDAEQISHVEEDAFITLTALLRIAIWFLKEFPEGPNYNSIYSGQIKKDAKTIILWNDISSAVSKKITKYLFEESGDEDYQIIYLEKCEDLLFYELDPDNIFSLILLVTDVTKLSDNNSVRQKINDNIERYVSNGGKIIGSHDLIYRRTRNEKLQNMFGCTLNQFERKEEPLVYKKSEKCINSKNFENLPKKFNLHDGEICWGNWAPDCEFLFKNQNDRPLFVLREYGDGLCVWMNSGDFKEFPPVSISKPEKNFIKLIKSTFDLFDRRE